MNDFKVGDRVVYKATAVTRTPDHGGHEGTVTKINNIEAVSVKWDNEDLSNRGGYLMENLRHLPAPDVITINRADLPEVSERSAWLMDGEWAIGGAHMKASTARKAVLRYLAAAEFIEARDKAAEEAAAAEREAAVKLNKRRDELADELAPRWDSSMGKNWYGNVSSALQKAIDRIIELESNRG